MNKLVSVIMPVHNCERTVIVSTKSILSQTYTNFEFLIYDDKSSDNTLKIVSRLKDKRIKLINGKTRQGVANSLNILLSKVKGEFVARMDADDIAHKKRIKEQVDFLRKNDEICAVGSWATIIDCAGKRISTKKTPVSFSQLQNSFIKENPIIHPSLTLRTDVLRKLGGYDQDFEGAEDYHLVHKMLNSGYKICNMPHYLIDYRRCSSSISYQTMKKVEWQALRVRFLALKSRYIRKYQVFQLLKPLVSFCMPKIMKKIYFNYE